MISGDPLQLPRQDCALLLTKAFEDCTGERASDSNCHLCVSNTSKERKKRMKIAVKLCLVHLVEKSTDVS